MRQLLGLMPNTNREEGEVRLPKGALPTGTGVAPDHLTKSHKDGRVRAQQPNPCVAQKGERLGLHKNILVPVKGPFHTGVCLRRFSIFKSSYFARH